MKLDTFCCGKINPLGVTSPVFSWKVSDCSDDTQLTYKIIVYDSNNAVVWDSGIIFSNRMEAEYKGPVLLENSKYFWQVSITTDNFSLTSDSYFVTGIFKTDGLTWIGADNSVNSPILLKKFNLDYVADLPVVNICGLGFFELYINGRKVSDEIMSPVRTDYDKVSYKNLAYPFNGETRKSVQYCTYDVSGYLKVGENVISVMLAGGWYKQRRRIAEGIFDYGKDLKMFLRLTNGNFTLDSDESWCYISGPVVSDNIFYGEVYDARLESQENGYKKVRVLPAPCGKISPMMCEPERIIETLLPKKISGNIWDSGKCMTGFAEIIFKGNRGDKITISYAENIKGGELDYESTLGYGNSDKNQIQSDTYILKGNGIESYMPRFVWHAFRYFKIIAEPSVEILNVKVHYVCTDVKKRTKFSCSNVTLNTLYNLCMNTLMCNTHGGVPMDCAHRERLGYTGDGQLSSLAFMYNFDAKNLYGKWLDDILDAQNQATGYVPHTAPFNGGGGGPSWGSAVAVIPWNMFLIYGDLDAIRKSRVPVKKWIEYLIERSNDFLVVREESGGWCLGDWCMPSKYPWSSPHLDEITLPNELVNTSALINCINIYCKMNNALGFETEPEILKFKENAVSAINKKYLNNGYADNSQGCNIFPLYTNVVPKSELEKIIEILKDIIKNNGYSFDCGIIGTSWLFSILDRYDLNHIALKMLICDKYPGYVNMIKNGATALWETWEGNGSYNHTAFSSVGAWFIYGLAGIKANEDNGGFESFTLKPFFPEELDHLEAEFESSYGTISVSWKRSKKGIDVEIKIPFNTTATLILDNKTHLIKHGKYKYFMEARK